MKEEEDGDSKGPSLSVLEEEAAWELRVLTMWHSCVLGVSVGGNEMYTYIYERRGEREEKRVLGGGGSLHL